MTEFQNPFPGRSYFRSEVVSGDTGGLHPAELALSKRFKAAFRRAEFITGRRCAQWALRQAGIPASPVYRQANRSPEWPFSIAGSITHGAGHAAAIVCQRASGIIGVGMDMEDLSREIKTNIARHVLTPWEIDRWLGGRAKICRELRIIFSIKETIYKCLNPLHGINLGFHDAEVLEMTGAEFKCRLLVSPLAVKTNLPISLQGRLAEKDDIILSAMIVSARELYQFLRSDNQP